MSFDKLIMEYAIVRDSVVKPTTKKPLAYWNTATLAELATEHAKNERVFIRKFAVSFITMFDKKMIKKFRSDFSAKQLMENMVANVSLGELVGYSKMQWGKFLLKWISEPSTGIGFDYVNQVGLATGGDNIITLHNAPYQGVPLNLRLDCLAVTGQTQKVPDLTFATVTIAHVQFQDDDPNSPIPEIGYSTIEVSVNSDYEGWVPVQPFALGVPDTDNYMLARIEFWETNAKGKKVSYQKGKFDTLQVVGWNANF